MPSEVILPRVDMDMTTGKISKWLVPSGATVTKGQPLFEIETDKATMEIEADADGTIRDMADASARDIPVGSVVAWIDAAGEQVPAKPTAGEILAEAPPSVPRETRENGARHRAGDGRTGTFSAIAETRERERATPLARRLAREHGIDLGGLKGTGPRGRIQAADIAALAKPDRLIASPKPVTFETTPSALAREPLESVVTAPRTLPFMRGSGPLRKLREGDGTPLLLIHGFGSEAHGWRPFLNGQTLTGPVLALDLPGHGSAPLSAVKTFADLVDAVESAIADAGFSTPIDVVGHSLGAAIATAVAARGALDIRSLLLLSPAGLGPEINGDFLQGYLAARSEASLMPWMHELVANPSDITPAFVRATLRAREATDQVAAQRAVAEAVFPDGTQSFSIRADLARLRMPTRIVFGLADRIIPARHATGLPPLVALHRLPNIGHMPHVEAQDVVRAILTQMIGAA